jgi:hypothetical protein
MRRVRVSKNILKRENKDELHESQKKDRTAEKQKGDRK